MADNILLNAPSVVGGKTVATKDVGGVQHEQVINEFLDSGGNPIQVSATTPFPVTNSDIAIPTTIFNGSKNVTTAGTRVTLAASQTVKSVTIKALSTNTGLIFVGNATVSSANGFQLSAGDTISMDISNLNTINIDSAVNGEGVTFFAVN